MSENLEALAKRVSRDPWFLGWALAEYQKRFGLTDAALADELSCSDVAVLVSLRLCRRPGGAAPDRSEEEDIRDIARRFGIDHTSLRRILGAVG